jgi:Glycosyl transferase family 2
MIPAMGRPEYLWSTVGEVLRPSFTDFEICVLDQSASAEADDAAAQFIAEHPDPRLRYIRLRARGLPNTRNEGIALARGETILFLDDDVILLSRDFLAAHVACYVPNARRTAGYVSWAGRTVKSRTVMRSCTLRSVKSANMSFRTRMVRRVGGYLGLLPFAATFGVIAVSGTVRWRSAAAMPRLTRAARKAIIAAALGPDDAVPCDRTMGPPSADNARPKDPADRNPHGNAAGLDQNGGFGRPLSGVDDSGDGGVSGPIAETGWQLRFEPGANLSILDCLIGGLRTWRLCPPN